jgi:toxin ParE1/3/4
MAEYRLAPAAERDLEKVWTYTARHWGVGQADRYIDIISTGFQELAQQPETAPACDHIRVGYRRHSVGRHMIYFKITTYGVVIVRVLHDRMDTFRRL